MEPNRRYEGALIVVASQSAMLHYDRLFAKDGDHKNARAQAIYWVAMVIAAIEGAPSAGSLPLDLQQQAEAIVDEAIASLYPSRSGTQN